MPWRLVYDIEASDASMVVRYLWSMLWHHQLIKEQKKTCVRSITKNVVMVIIMLTNRPDLGLSCWLRVVCWVHSEHSTLVANSPRNFRCRRNNGLASSERHNITTSVCVTWPPSLVDNCRAATHLLHLCSCSWLSRPGPVCAVAKLRTRASCVDIHKRAKPAPWTTWPRPHTQMV